MKGFHDLTASQEAIIKHYMPDDNSLKNIADYYYIFSDITRLKILISLTMKSMCVGDMSQVLDLNQTTISHQLQILRSKNIVSSKRVKKNIYYMLASEDVEKIIEYGVDANII